MGTVNLSLPADGETIDAADYNTPITTFVNEFNGEIDNANIASDAAIAGTKLADNSITVSQMAETMGAGTAGDGTWTSWTPALTASIVNPTLGTASVQEGRYTQIGKTIIAKGTVKFGTSGTNAGSGTYYISLPVTADMSFTFDTTIPTGYMRAVNNNLGENAVGAPELETSTTFQLVFNQYNTVSSDLASMNHAAPFSWAASDSIHFYLVYEAA